MWTFKFSECQVPSLRLSSPANLFLNVAAKKFNIFKIADASKIFQHLSSVYVSKRKLILQAILVQQIQDISLSTFPISGSLAP